MTTDYPPTTHKDFETEIDTTRLMAVLRRPSSSAPAKLSDADRAAYLAMLNGAHPAPLAPEKANAILDALWHIMTAFVDLGFGVGPVAAETPAPCGKLLKNQRAKCDKRGDNALSYPYENKAKNQKTAPVGTGEKARES